MSTTRCLAFAHGAPTGGILMSSAPAVWGDQIAVETLHGVPYRMYTERPRRVESLLAYARTLGRPAAHHPGRSRRHVRRAASRGCRQGARARGPRRRARRPRVHPRPQRPGVDRQFLGLPRGWCRTRPCEHMVERQGSCERPRSDRTRPHAGRRARRPQHARGKAMRSLGHPRGASAGQRSFPTARRTRKRPRSSSLRPARRASRRPSCCRIAPCSRACT